MRFAFIQRRGRRGINGLAWHTATVWMVTPAGLARVGQLRDQYRWDAVRIAGELSGDHRIGLAVTADQVQELEA